MHAHRHLHCVPQPATGSSSPTHRFHPSGDGGPPPAAVAHQRPTRGVRPCASASPLGAAAPKRPNPCTPHTRGFGPPGGSNRGRQPHVDQSAVKVTTFGDPLYSSGRYPSPQTSPGTHASERLSRIGPLAADTRHAAATRATRSPHACRISGHPPQTPDTPLPSRPPTPRCPVYSGDRCPLPRTSAGPHASERLSRIGPHAANTRHATPTRATHSPTPVRYRATHRKHPTRGPAPAHTSAWSRATPRGGDWGQGVLSSRSVPFEALVDAEG